MKRSAPLRRSGAIRSRSAKRAAEAPERRALVARLIEERRRCEAGAVMLNALLPSLEEAITDPVERRWLVEAWRACREWEPVDGHEVIKRSRGGDYLDEANILVVCRPCHDFTEHHVALSTRIGLLAPSWSRNPPAPSG